MQWLLLLQMELLTQVQILYEAIKVSLCINTLGTEMNSSLLSSSD